MDPLVLAFDLDDTLFEAQILKDEKSALSSSAGAYRGSTPTEMAIRPILKTDLLTKEEYRAEQVRAINQIELSQIFRKMQHTLDLAKQMNVASPLAVKIITTASYDKEHILHLLDHFYFDDEQILRDNNRFPIEYFNKHDLGPPKGVRSTPDRPTKCGLIDLRKETLISKMFPIWTTAMPKLEKKRVVLVDNADSHIAAVIRKGFTGLHYPTTPNDRLEGITYSVHGKNTLNELHRLIDEVQQNLANLTPM